MAGSKRREGKEGNIESKTNNWKEKKTLKNLLGNPPKSLTNQTKSLVASRHQTRIVYIERSLRKIKNRKAVSLDKIPPKIWKTRKFDDPLLRLYNTIYKQKTIQKWTKSCIRLLLKKSDIGIIKNCRRTAVAVKFYNLWLLICIQLKKIKKNLWKIQNFFRRNRS